MATIVEAEIKIKAEKAIKQVKDLNVEIESVKDQVKDVNEEADKTGKKGKKGVGRLSKAFKGLGTAIKGAGIGLVVAGFAALFAALKSNQKVVDAFNVVMGTISQVFTEIGNVLVTVYENVSSSTENFDALGKVMGGILTLVVTPFKITFLAIKNAILEAQLAWEKSFFGGNDPERIAELNASINETVESFKGTIDSAVDAGKSIVNNFGEAITEVGDIGSQVMEGLSDISLEAINDQVAANVQLKKDAERARIANQGLIEQYDRQAEQQRQIRDDDTKNIDDRIAANNKLKEELEEQKKLMLENVKLMIQQAQAQFDLTGKEEDYLALLSVKNEKKAVEAQIEGFMSEQKSNNVALQKEALDLDLASTEALANRQKMEKDFEAEMEVDELTKIQMQMDNLAKEKEVEELRLENKKKSYEEGTQAYKDAEIELLDFTQESNNEKIRLETLFTDTKKKLQQDLLLNVANTLGGLSGLLKEGTGASKAAAIADILIKTGVGFAQGMDIAQKTAAGTGPFAAYAYPLFYAQQIISVLSAIKKAKEIMKKVKGGGGGGAEVASPPAAIQPPDFNVVGQGAGNQIADVISNQQPIQAFVVSNDVTTAQELDRNIITGASLG